MFEKKPFMKMFVWGAGVVAVLAAVSLFLWHAPVAQSHTTLKIGNSEVAIEIARTAAEQEKGLGNRASLEVSRGMLFVFSEPLTPAFWMKDMHFPIDMVWVKNDHVIGFEENVDPQIGASDRELKTYEPTDTVDSVVELHAGAVRMFGVRVGDEVNTSRYFDEPQRWAN